MAWPLCGDATKTTTNQMSHEGQNTSFNETVTGRVGEAILADSRGNRMGLVRMLWGGPQWSQGSLHDVNCVLRAAINKNFPRVSAVAYQEGQCSVCLLWRMMMIYSEMILLSDYRPPL